MINWPIKTIIYNSGFLFLGDVDRKHVRMGCEKRPTLFLRMSQTDISNDTQLNLSCVEHFICPEPKKKWKPLLQTG